MHIGIYILVFVVVAGVSFYLGEKYGAKEVARLEKRIHDLNLALQLKTEQLTKDITSHI